ncbi:MAG: Imidazoleglycerol-phosphate dehydratase [bacterium 42_11]|nr:MAG: Imidazoleglycerol-phosphate dehydratase [bacterium 42_11]
MVEDVGIVLGEAFKRALDKRENIKRFGFFLMPMDDALVEIALDLAERAFLVFDVELNESYVGKLETSLIEEFWKAFTSHAFITLHIVRRRGKNAHHIIEAIFKGVGKALKMALEEEKGVPSTKGVM